MTNGVGKIYKREREDYDKVKANVAKCYGLGDVGMKGRALHYSSK